MRPKFPQPIDAGIRRVARDDGGIDRTDRYAGDPVRMDIGFRKRLVDASLICPERTAALQQQGNALERQPPFRGREVWSKLEIHCVSLFLRSSDHSRAVSILIVLACFARREKVG